MEPITLTKIKILHPEGAERQTCRKINICQTYHLILLGVHCITVVIIRYQEMELKNWTKINRLCTITLESATEKFG